MIEYSFRHIFIDPFKVQVAEFSLVLYRKANKALKKKNSLLRFTSRLYCISIYHIIQAGHFSSSSQSRSEKIFQFHIKLLRSFQTLFRCVLCVLVDVFCKTRMNDYKTPLSPLYRTTLHHVPTIL
ncbi:hypothetical protein QTP88_012335 [Uroleucon formosanum]